MSHFHDKGYISSKWQSRNVYQTLFSKKKKLKRSCLWLFIKSLIFLQEYEVIMTCAKSEVYLNLVSQSRGCLNYEYI